MNKPLVTITIPTFNSGAFLAKCLIAVRNQTYMQIEVTIVDGGSIDNTLEVAKTYRVNEIYSEQDALLEARCVGINQAKGTYVLLLDSDQILKPDAVERAVAICEEKKVDMLVLEEGVYRPKSILEKLFQEDRKLVHAVKDFSPYTGVLLPRFYQTGLLKKAIKNIPEKIRKTVGGQDHAIIYLEVWQLSKSVDLLHNAVEHIEPNSFSQIWKKFYRWGKTSKHARLGKYEDMITQKERFRTGMFSKGFVKASVASLILLALKGVPYKAGVLSNKIRN